MVKPVRKAEVLGFSKGLNTEANPLSGVADSSADELNFEIHQDGTRSRRLGLDSEIGSSYTNSGQTWTTLAGAARASFLWEGVGGDPNKSYVVVQLGSTLYIFNPGAGSLGETAFLQSVTLGVSSDNVMSMASVEGYLVVASGSPDIVIVDADFNPITLRIKIRDQFGVQETEQPLYEIDSQYRGNITRQHYYNLYNQGWAIPRYAWQFGSPPLTDSVNLGSDFDVFTRTPSNSDTVWSGLEYRPVGKDAEGNYTSIEAFSYQQFSAITGANTEAGKGFFLIDAFQRGSSRSEAWLLHRNKYPQTGGILGGDFTPPSDTTLGGPTAIAAHAGRIFYSGCRGEVFDGDSRSPNYSSFVFFTQLVKAKSDFGKCYQEGDPSSRDSNTLLDTDGGFFTVSGAVNIHKMFSLGSRLFMIANNGVWSITGGSDYGFSATNYKVDKLSNFGGIPGQSVVLAGDAAFFWGYDGIYNIGKNQYGDYVVQNISKPVINNFYKDITKEAKNTAQGLYDKPRNQVRWVYIEGEPFTVGSKSRELVLDLNFNGYYPYEFSSAGNQAYLFSGIQTGDFATVFAEEEVFVGIEQVLVGTTVVVANTATNTAVASTVSYLTAVSLAGNVQFRFANYRNTSFEDWSFVGVPTDAPAYIRTNALTGGDFSVNKQAPYLVMAFAETERLIVADEVVQESSCIGQTLWNFTHNARSGKWSREMQMYRKRKFYMGEVDIDNGFSLNLTKTKLRGIGRSLAFHFKTEPKKACHIYGWSISMTGNDLA